MGNESTIKPYTSLTLEEINNRYSMILSLWDSFLKTVGEPKLKYIVNKQNLYEVIKRQDKRMYYYRVFHKLDYPCEYKFMAIECFWINTLKPFFVEDESSAIYSCANEQFSLYLILSLIREVMSIHRKDVPFEQPTAERMKEILYDFKYCSLSREAMISFVETFADNYFVGIDYIQKNKDKIKNLISDSDISKLWGNKYEE